MEITLPFRVMGVDPAMGQSGWSVFDIVSLNPLRLQIVAHGKFQGDTLLRQRKELNLLFSRQFCIVDVLFEEYKRLMELYKPDQVVSEGAFGHQHLAVLVSLTLAIHELRRASKEVLGKDIQTVPPTISKLAWTGKGGSDKDTMRLAYQTHKFLEGTVADEFISEHEIDSLAHGYAFLAVYVLGIVKILTGKEKRAAKQERKEKALEKARLKEEANFTKK